MNIESRKGCKDLIRILEKSIICFMTCVDHFFLLLIGHHQMYRHDIFLN